MRVRKKPVEVEAIQWNGHNNQDIEDFAQTAITVYGEGSLSIETLEGTMRALPGDWIIKGVNGEFYPCKPDIFDKTYEVVNGD